MAKKKAINWDKIKRIAHTYRLLIVIVIIAFIIRIYFFKNTQTEMNQDGYWFSAIAKSILKGKYEINGGFASIWPPFYPFLMALTSLIFHDFLLSGKIISLIAGVSAIPIIYLLWEKLESKEVALLTCWLISVNEVAWFYSLHVFRETLYLFLLSLSFLLLFEAKEDFKKLPALAIVLGLASLTREEGYLLALSLFITLLYWKKDHLKRREFKEDELRYSAYSIIIYVYLAIIWQIYEYIVTGTIVTPYVSEFIKTFGHIGLKWFIYYPLIVGWPIFLISLFGIYLTWNEKEKYLPFYLYITFFSLLHMWFFQGLIKYAIQTLPLFLGWFSIAVLHTFSKFPNKQRIKPIFLILLILYPFVPNANSMLKTKNRGDYFEVDKIAMTWFDANTEKDARLVGGDYTIYGYYTPKHNTPLQNLVIYTSRYLKLGSIDLTTYRKYPYMPYIAYMIENNIHYLVAYDSTTPWLFSSTKWLKDDFTIHRFNIKDKQVILSPFKRFEKNNDEVYIYKVTWE